MIVSVFKVHEVNGQIRVEKIPPEILGGTDKERNVAIVIDQTVRWALEFAQGQFTSDQLKTHLIQRFNEHSPEN